MQDQGPTENRITTPFELDAAKEPNELEKRPTNIVDPTILVSEPRTRSTTYHQKERKCRIDSLSALGFLSNLRPSRFFSPGIRGRVGLGYNSLSLAGKAPHKDTET